MSFALVANTGGGLGANGGTSAAINTTGADFLIVGLVYQPSSNPVLSDSKGNTWTSRSSVLGTTPCILYYVKNAIVGSGHTITVSGSGIYCAAHFAAFSGSDLTSPFDVENGNVSIGSASTISTGSITPNVANELVISLGAHGGANAPSVDLVTLLTTTVLTGGSNYSSGFAYEIQTTITARNLTWSTNSGVTDFSTVIASFKAAAGATPVTRSATDTISLSDSATATFSSVNPPTIFPPPAPPTPLALGSRNIWTDEQITKWSADALVAIANDLKCIWARESLPIVVGQSVVILPTYVRTLQRVTWRGNMVTPVSWIELQLLSPGQAALGRPQFYAMHPTGIRNLILYPAANEAFAGGGNPYSPQTNSDELIVAYWRTPDGSASNSPISLPTYIARRTQKAYVLWKAFAAEGRGQDLAASQYYKGRYQFLIEKFRHINEGAFISKRYSLGDGEWPALARPARPQLGPNFERTTF